MVKKKNYKKYGTLFSGESNPFNVKVNRKKHSILGSDVKGTRGLPSISKGISYAKRKEFFKKNKTANQKSNTYIDKRKISQNESFEDNVTSRFIREGQKKSKKNVFNLNGDGDSTQKRSNLHDSKILDDRQLSSDEEDTSFTSKRKFGDTNSEAPKTHKEIIEEMIADSKQRKMEKKMEKEKYLNTLEQVDNAWRQIHSISSKVNPSKSANKIVARELVESNTKDTYDISKFELKFEQKCSSISHTRGEDEIAKEEEKKRAQLEKEKLSRMTDNRDANNTKTINHVSADAILDEYEYLQPIATAENKLEVASESEDSDNESVSSHSSADEMDQQQSDFELEGKSLKEDSVLTFDIPDHLEEFKVRVKDYNAEQLSSVLDSILKKFIKSKNEKILSKLENFSEILLQYTFELCEKSPKSEHLGSLPPHLHALANAVNVGVAQRFLKLLGEEHQIFTTFKKRRMKRNFPRPQAIVILKYAASIYSTSDFRHPVITPAMIFMCDILESAFCITFANVLSRFLISELILNCISESKRFVPEAIHFLNKVLLLAIPEKSKSKKNSSSTKLFDLIISNKVSNEDVPTLELFHLNGDLAIESEKIGIIFTVTNQLLQYATLYNQLPSFKEIFAPTLTICTQLPIALYPVALQNHVKKLIKLVQQPMALTQLTFQKAKPKPLKMFEPAFESKFNQKDDINKKRKQIKKVAQKIKKEEKSMLREIRRDAQVTASEKLREKLELDAERKRKVKEIYGSLAVQEGEFKKMMKKKP